MKSSGSKTVKGPDGFIYEIKIDSIGNEWIDIGRAKKWVKRCPVCGKIELCFPSFYKKYKGKNCRSCSCSIRNKTDKMRQSSSKSKQGEKNHFYGLTGDKNPARRPEVRIKLKEYQNRPDVKENHRRVYLDMVGKKREKKGVYYSIKSCNFMDVWGKENGYNFRHAMNSCEQRILSYWVDGYDPEKNVVFEYDEPYHFVYRRGGVLKSKDVDRMHKIQSQLNCIFIRYNERKGLITYYIPSILRIGNIPHGNSANINRR